MSMEIENGIRSMTTHCLKDFECLKNENATCLNNKVDRWLDGKVLFMHCNENCNYKMSFGNSTICNCPTRKEIYKNYSK